MRVLTRSSAALLVWLLAGRFLHCWTLRLAIVPEPSTAGSEQQDGHDLAALAGSLLGLGHSVTTFGPDSAEGLPTSKLNTGEITLFDAILTQGTPARLVADPAAKEGIPVIRFVGEGDAVEPHHVFFEQPAALVFASEAQRAACGDSMMQEAIRLVISRSSAPKEAAKELDALLRRLSGPHGQAVQADNLPPLGLVMIVKNEAASISATLASMRADLDYWTIVDTGSTDGTQAVVREFMAGYPGQLLEEPFVDFSTTRNYALRAHGQKTAYAFMVDADYAVNGTWRLRLGAQRLQRECQNRALPVCARAIQIRLHSGASLFYTTRVFPTAALGTDAGWRYRYPVHEVPSHSGLPADGSPNTIRAPEVVMWNLPIAHNKSSERWKNVDLPLLQREHRADPSDARIVFYLAQTLDLIGEDQAALDMYQKRIDMRGWGGEVFEAHMRRGRIKHERMPAPWAGAADPRPDFLAAAGQQPERAEPHLWMAWHHHKAMDACPGGPDQAVCWLRERAAAYHYAKRAAALDMPDEGLFLHAPAYEHQALEALVLHAWYAAKHLAPAARSGAAAARDVLARHPGPPHRARNALLYEALARSLRPAGQP